MSVDKDREIADLKEKLESARKQVGEYQQAVAKLASENQLLKDGYTPTNPINLADLKGVEAKQQFHSTKETKDMLKEIAEEHDVKLNWNRNEKVWEASVSVEKAQEIQSQFDKTLVVQQEQTPQSHSFQSTKETKDVLKEVAEEQGVELNWNRTSKTWDANVTEDQAKKIQENYNKKVGEGIDPAEKKQNEAVASLIKTKESLDSGKIEMEQAKIYAMAATKKINGNNPSWIKKGVDNYLKGQKTAKSLANQVAKAPTLDKKETKSVKKSQGVSM